jgi:hypothetical protein
MDSRSKHGYDTKIVSATRFDDGAIAEEHLAAELLLRSSLREAGSIIVELEPRLVSTPYYRCICPSLSQSCHPSANGHERLVSMGLWRSRLALCVVVSSNLLVDRKRICKKARVRKTICAATLRERRLTQHAQCSGIRAIVGCRVDCC